MKQTFIILLACFGMQPVFAKDELVKILREEVDRNMKVLSTQPLPAYYLSYRVQEVEGHSMHASFGQLVKSTPFKNRKYHTSIRVGDPQLDNTRELSTMNFNYNPYFQEDYFFIHENNPSVIKNLLWKRTDGLYKNSVRQYENVQTNRAMSVAATDRAGDFTTETAEQYFEQPLPSSLLADEITDWEEKIKKYSAVFAGYKDILVGHVELNIELFRKYFVDSDGIEVVQNQPYYSLNLSAITIADDGMELPLYQTYFGFEAKDLPSDEEVEKAAHRICDMLIRLKNAPVADVYTGPALLTGKAAGIFFHEIFGHRIEGARLKQEKDGQTFKNKIGEQVLPADFSIFFDPQKKEYNGNPLNGHYVFDDEGIRGQKVNIVENGILKSFLMSRTPIDGFSGSNGHGRAMISHSVVTRQSNMFIESSNPKSEKELREMLIAEAKKNNQPYAYLFDEVKGGFTRTERFDLNAFNVNPLVVYRIYVDGRPDELVRGVDIVGTPLSMFSQIEACGDQASIFNGICGAESGSIPVSAVCPSLFVKAIETQKKPKSQAHPPVLERP